MPMKNFDTAQLADDYAKQSPQKILELALEHFDNLWLSFSGANDIVVLDMAVNADHPIGQHPEHYTLGS